MPGFDMTSISIVEPGHKSYETLEAGMEPSATSRHQSTAYYNEIIQAYNDSPVGAILLVPLPAGKAVKVRYHNLRNVFSGRGLELKVDVLITRQQTDENGKRLPMESRPVKIKKLTAKQGKIVDCLFSLPEDDE